MDIEKLNERLKEKFTIEEYQQLSALMFRNLDKYFWDKVGKKNGKVYFVDSKGERAADKPANDTPEPPVHFEPIPDEELPF